MHTHVATLPFGLVYLMNGAHTMKLPFFGTRIGGNKESNATSTTAGHVKIDTVNASFTAIDASGIGDRNDLVIQSTPSTLGVHTGEIAVVSSGGSHRMDVASPIHTSSHYQTFETSFLNELVGGDRNMEQTNLVVTADGKTWDEVTRDTSYIGNLVLTTQTVAGNANAAAIFSEWRGAKTNLAGYNFYKTDYVVWGYDRAFILKDGFYELERWSKNIDSYPRSKVFVNGTAAVNTATMTESGSGGWISQYTSATLHLKRGDWIQVYQYTTSTTPNDRFDIRRIDK